jgi:hypothetical protein
MFLLEFLTSIFTFYGLQVASLQFGNFYDVQYVKMYGIFMGQLQVGLIFVTRTAFLFIWFYFEYFGWLCDNVMFDVEHSPAYHKYTWSICKWLYWRTSWFIYLLIYFLFLFFRCLSNHSFFSLCLVIYTEPGAVLHLIL